MGPSPSTYAFSFLTCFSALFLRCESQTPPSDKFNCNLNASSPFSYIVKIWDDSKKVIGKNFEPGPVSFGSLINAKAVLSSAWYYWREMKSSKFADSGGFARFTVIGQNVWNYNSLLGYKDPCYQDKKVTNIKLHPKARERGERMYFDFSVIVLNAPFKTFTPEFFIKMPFPVNPRELLLQIRYINVNAMESQGACAIPVPSRITAKYWTYNNRIDFSSLPFHTQCIKYLCDQLGSSQWFDTCVRNFNKRLNATILCMIPGWIKNIVKDFPRVPTSYSGIPLVCNGTVLGISAQIKERVDFTEYNQDIFFVVTLLRVLPWLIERTLDSDTTIPTTTVGSDIQSTDYSEFPRPSTISTEDWGQAEFFKLPNVENPFQPFSPAVVPKGLSPRALSCLSFCTYFIIFIILLYSFS